MVDNIRGNPSRHIKSLKSVEYIYFVVNINNNHWVSCEVALTAWIINVDDLDISLNTNVTIPKAFQLFAKMLLSRLLGVNAFTNHLTIKGKNVMALKVFSFNQLGSDMVPQSKRR